MADLPGDVLNLLGGHPAVESARLIGSRANGTATPISDWDFEVEARDFPALAAALPGLFAPLRPLCTQWDRLSKHQTFMVILPGAEKVDLLFLGQPHAIEPPWRVSADTLPAIDGHFWDWILWLASKVLNGRGELVREELAKLHEHILGPMGAPIPDSLEQAVAEYRRARSLAERRYGVEVRRALEDAVAGRLRGGGFAV
ncbi:MAG: hypothetical protein ACM3S1_15005 [Hyphomicrobiales bacterium]